MKTCVECGKTYDELVRFCPDDGTALTSSSSEDLVGRVIGGKYRVLARIGVGGFSQIFQARHVQMPREVALKVLGKERGQRNEQRQRFLREVRTIAALDHPDVVPIYDVGEDPQCGLYMALRLMEGEDLGDRLDRDGPLPIQDTWAIVQAVCRGLQAAHDEGIIHRDVKPYNIFLERDDMALVGFSARLIDFGIATVRGDDDRWTDTDKHQLTADGQVMGSADTMSPEAATGQQVDHRADLFSVGVCFFSMLTGQQPYKGDTPREMLVRRVIGPPPPPSTCQGCEWIPRCLDDLVLSLLAVDPGMRPASAEAVIAELQSIRPEVEAAWAEHFLSDHNGLSSWDWDTRPDGAQPARGRPLVVLLADDEPAILDLAALLLTRGGAAGAHRGGWPAGDGQSGRRAGRDRAGRDDAGPRWAQLRARGATARFRRGADPDVHDAGQRQAARRD